MSSFLGGLLSPALTTATNAASAYQGAQAGAMQKKNEDAIAQAMAQAKALQQKHNDEILNTLRGAQTTKALQPPIDPTKTHEANRLFDNAHPSPFTGPEQLLPVMQDGKAIYTPRSKAVGAEAPRAQSQEPAVLVQNPSDPQGPGVYTARSEAIGQQAPRAGGGIGTAGLRKAVATNRTQLSIIDDAVRELDQYPGAIGGKRGMGDFISPLGGISDKVNQMVDPKGVNARASLSNIASLVIHDRSGSAVTVSEFPRLAPFIPRQSDDAATAKKKLAKLKQAIEAETGFLEEQTGKTQGPPAGPTPGRPPTASRAQQLWDEAVKLHGKAKVLQEYGPRPAGDE